MPITKDQLTQIILANGSFNDLLDDVEEDEEDEDEDEDEEKESVENPKLDLVKKMWLRSQTDDEEVENGEDEYEITEDVLEQLDLPMILDIVDHDSVLSLINNELGNGILNGDIECKDAQIKIHAEYRDESGTDLVIVTENKTWHGNTLDALLDAMNGFLASIKENLESDEGMEFF